MGLIVGFNALAGFSTLAGFGTLAGSDAFLAEVFAEEALVGLRLLMALYS